MSEIEEAKKELADLDRRIERATSRIENDSELGTLSYDVGASDAAYESFIGDVSAAILNLCGDKRNALRDRIAALEAPSEGKGAAPAAER